MSGRKWTDEEIKVLTAMYPHATMAQMLQAIDRTDKSIISQAWGMGLAKSDDYMASEKSGRFKGRVQSLASQATWFKPGRKTWNAGRKGWQAGGRSVDTQFRSGSMPPNTMPLGSYRLVKEKNGDQHLEQKVRNVPGPNHLRWTPVARLVWEAAHGPVPAGSIVVFKPGQRTLVLDQITLERVECITRRQNAWRNHPASSSPEIAGLMQLKGAITRQVNRITQQHKEQQQSATL